MLASAPGRGARHGRTWNWIRASASPARWGRRLSQAPRLTRSENRFPITACSGCFFRQTFDLGGEVKGVEGAANQLAGSHTADDLVFTLGKISVGDIFDTNSYAHDPRGDFLNWANVDAGAFGLCRRRLGLQLWHRGGMEYRRLERAGGHLRSGQGAQWHRTGARLSPVRGECRAGAPLLAIWP